MDINDKNIGTVMTVSISILLIFLLIFTYKYNREIPLQVKLMESCKYLCPIESKGLTHYYSVKSFSFDPITEEVKCICDNNIKEIKNKND